MDDRRKDQAERIVKRYAHLIEMQAGKAVRPYRADGYVNMMNKYGTSKDTTEGYRFRAEPVVPDELLTMYYEGNGLFAKIIDTPAEEAIKHGFTLESTKDQKIEDFYTEALDELDWEEMAMTAVRWARLFGGSIAVMMINDGRGIDEPLDWRNIRSIDDIRVYDRSVIQPDYQSMFSYDPRDPFRTRGSRLGMPEFYHVTSRTGSFTVHDSRCLVFQNGILPENTTNSIYQLWGIPEYVRINRAIRDAEVAHGSATKLLDRSVQAVYKMKDLAAELATEEGEDRVLRRLQTIDMARGLLNSITIDSEGEDYDFRQFQFSGVSDVIDSTCNFLSALTSIPQTILFGRSPAGMNATGDADLENWYNYLERIQKRMVKKNLRYLLSVIFQAGVRTGEVDEVPKIKVEFNPLWSLSDTEQADLDQKRAQTQFTRAQTAQLYIDKQVIDPSEVRAKLADSEEFDVENMLDEYDDEDLFPDEPAEGGQVSGDVGQSIFEQGQFAGYAEGTSTEEHKKDPGGDGEAPAAAPAATKLPQDMSDEERQQSAANAPQNRAKASVQDVKGDGNTSTQEDTKACVGVLVVSQGKVLSGTRKTEFGHGLICGPGGHIKEGESPKQAAFREAEEEFGISPKELIPLGRGPMEPDTGIQPYIFLCTEYEGEPNCVDGEMADPQFRTLEEIELLTPSLFQPFADDVKLLKAALRGECDPFEEDGGPGSGNHGHEGVPGQVGGSAPSLTPAASKLLHGKSEDFKAEFLVEKGMRFREVDKAIQAGKLDELVDEKLREVAKERKRVADKAPDDSKVRKSAEKASLEIRNNVDETLVSYDEDGNEIARDTGSAHGVKSGQNNAAYSTLHNHPGDTDSCFSDTDVRSFAKADEQVMYMTSKTKLYSLQKTSDYDGYSARSVATHLESLEKKYQDGDMTRNDLIAETDLYLQLYAHEYGLVYKQQEVDGK
jgi:phage-related protein (TIGR01555 family)